MVGPQPADNVETGVDRLISFLRGRGLTPLKEISEKLKVPMEVVQTWIDFLVEEKVVSMEYKLTTPYVYLIKDVRKDEDTPEKARQRAIDQYKRDFEAHARTSRIPESKTSFLWRNHVTEELDRKKNFFSEEAKKRGFTEIQPLWDEYKRRLLEG